MYSKEKVELFLLAVDEGMGGWRTPPTSRV